MADQTAQTGKINPRMIVSVVFFLLYTPLVLFISSGQLDWWMAWMYSIIAIVLSLGSRALMARRHPDLVSERASYRNAEGAKAWDRKLVPLVAQVGPFFMLLVAGLDKRFTGSPPISIWISLAALAIAILGFVFSTWALIENQFFSSIVRIQTDRGHTVCSSGPYRFIRHPGYAGGLIWYLMTPLILGSIWAFIPTAFVVALTVLRTSLEDKTLMAELPGYQAYANQTRHRLIPGFW